MHRNLAFRRPSRSAAADFLHRCRVGAVIAILIILAGLLVR